MPSRPNLLFVIADDLGFSDVGCYGAEIDTPAIDSLARDGVRMLNYHTAAACSPTRAMLLTGTDAHLGGLGCLIEAKAAKPGGKTRWDGKPGYEGYLNKEVAPLSEILQDNGYHTVLSGKWHLGMRQDAGPWARGFTKSFSMLPGCCNHYGWEPVLEDGDHAFKIGGRPIHAEDGVHVRVPPNTCEDGFYSSDKYADQMIDYLSNRTEAEKSKPFFGYLAYTAPHWPIQCDEKYRVKYRGKYNGGPLELRKKRLARMINLGIIPSDVTPHDVVYPNGYSEWHEFDDDERARSIRCMETYAGMIEQMDASLGRVLNHLKATGEYDNTLIVFMSDNGAEGAAYEAMPVLGDNIRRALTTYFDNSLENIGKWNSFTWIGPLWAQASTAPSRLFKGFPSEGGILVPCVVKMPKATYSPAWTAGSVNRSFTTCMDLTPTFLDMIDVTMPLQGRKQLHRERATHPIRGKSWLPYIRDSKSIPNELFAIYRETEAVGWEMHELAALRKGHYKIVFIKANAGGKAVESDDPKGWELFNVTDDPGETIDLAEREPAVFADLLAEWDRYVQEMGVVWGPDAMKPGLSKDEAPHLHDVDFELQRTWLQTPGGRKPLL